MEQLKSSYTRAFDDYHLRFYPENLNANYGCSVFFDDGKSQNEIRYKLDISFIGNVENEVRSFRIQRDSEIYINDIKPEAFIDTLAFEVSECLYPLEIRTTKDGKLNTILNFEEIISRWEITKKRIQEDYKGDLTEKYIKATEKSLQSEEILLQKISKDWLIHLYFNSLYKFYSEDLYIDTKIEFPVINNIKPLEYQVKSKIQLDKDTEDIRLDIKGTIDDERSALDIEQKLDYPYYKEQNKNEKSLKGTCNLIYLFEGNTGIIEAIEAEFNTKLSPPKKILVKLFLLKKLDNNTNFSIENEKENESKDGFWSKLFKTKR